MSDKEFTCYYPFKGGQWGFTIWATDHAEAQERLKAMAWAKVDGEIMAKSFAGQTMAIEKGPDAIERAFFRVADGVFKLLNLYVRYRNALRSQAPKT